MTTMGKDLRARRLINPGTGRCVLFAISHGTSATHVLPELEQTADHVEAAIEGGSDCVLISPGLATSVAGVLVQHPAVGVVAKVTATAY
jgi:DhnA family fructose-bisphosphate aldolase class Ia